MASVENTFLGKLTWPAVTTLGIPGKTTLPLALELFPDLKLACSGNIIFFFWNCPLTASKNCFSAWPTFRLQADCMNMSPWLLSSRFKADFGNNVHVDYWYLQHEGISPLTEREIYLYSLLFLMSLHRKVAIFSSLKSISLTVSLLILPPDGAKVTVWVF